MGISSSDSGLVQVIGDNFDANISSPNGLISTHGLAMIVTQPETEDINSSETLTIERLKRIDISKVTESDIEVRRYYGPKKTSMPKSCSLTSPLKLKELARQAIDVQDAKCKDYRFLKHVLRGDVPEFNGFNSKESR